MNGSRNSGGSGGIIGIIAVIVVGAGGLIAVHKLLPSLFTVLVWVIAAIAVLIIALIIVIIIFANRSSKNKDERTSVNGTNLSQEETQILSTARSQVMELRRIIQKVHVQEVRLAANEDCGLLDKILQTLKKQTDEINSTRQCLDYYIPTLKSVMSHFQELEANAQLSDEMKEKTVSFLGDVKKALQKQYDNLFNNEKMNMEVEMEAMKITIKRDGLL